MASRNNEVSVLARQALNPPTHFSQLYNPSPSHYYYSAPPSIYFISDSSLPLPSSVWVYYPLWFINPNPNRPLLATPNPNQVLSPPPSSGRRVSGRRDNRRGKKVTGKRKITHKQESNEDDITTVMLRNIPNRYTREMMIEFIDEQCEQANKNEKYEDCPLSAYDFVYLPMDFKTKLNKGYAFVNFTNAKAASKFKDACKHKPWSRFRSKKVLETASAMIQGKDELVKHFQPMTYPDEAYSAVCFSPARTGPESTVQTIMVGKCTEPTGSI